MSHTQHVVDDQEYMVAFQIISLAGSARSLAMEAVELLESNAFEQAMDLIKQAQQAQTQCHKIQTDLLHAEAQGKKSVVNIVMVHAQDHLSMAQMSIDHALGLFKVYQRLYALEKGGKE